ncbi:IS66 family insertion sequence element accessory protein TnpA, partial [Marinagarivorans algicola]|uniref:IS66 family insertion sequence element accessory protein TnpA n=1 Tax=Marinagarivorans algicola TaxID=1513270 RepID=UPI00373690D8
MKRSPEAEWQALIKEQAQSGLTATEFCKQRGISGKYFSLRKQRLLKADPEQMDFAVASIRPESSAIEIRLGHTAIRLPVNQSPPKRKPLPKDLPRETRVIDITDEEKV